MSDFDPAAYLAQKRSQRGGAQEQFDPAAYLKAKRESSSPPEPSWLDKAKAAGGQILEATKQQGKGALGSFGVDVRTPEESNADAMGSSIMVPPEQKAGVLSRKIGGYAGDAAMYIAADLAAGVAMPTLVAKYGLGAVKAAITQGGLAGAGYEAIKGAFNNTPPMQTVENMGRTGLATGALSVPLHYAGKVGEWLTQDAPEGLANQYLNTPKKIAEDLYESNKPSLGKQLLGRTDLGIGTGKDAAYRDFGGELADNEMLIQSGLSKRVEQAMTPNQPNVQINGTPQLTYNPATVENRGLAARSSDPTIAPPTTVSEYVPEKNVTFTGQRTGRFSKVDPLGTYVEKMGPATPTSPQTTYGGFEKTTQVGSLDPVTEPVAGRSGLADAVRSLKTPERFPFTGIKQGPLVDLDATRQKLMDIGNQKIKAGLPDAARGYFDVANDLPKKSAVDLDEGNFIRRGYDSEVNSGHLSDPNKLSTKIDAQRIVANDIREQVATAAPEIAGLLDRNHFLMNVQTSLKPQNAGTAPVTGGGDFWKSTARGLLGNRVGLGAARGLATVGDSGVGGFVKPAARLGLAENMKR